MVFCRRFSDQAALLSQDNGCVLDLDREVMSIHAASDLHEASRAVHSDERSAGILDVLDLPGQNRCSDLRKLDAVGSAESAADIGVDHLDQIDAVGLGEKFSLLLVDAQLSSEVAGIMIGDGDRRIVAGLRQAAEIIEQLAEVGFSPSSTAFLYISEPSSKNCLYSRSWCVQVGHADTT